MGDPVLDFMVQVRTVRVVAWAGVARRIGAGLVLAILLGATAGVAFSALAGARRTASAYPRLQAAGYQADLVIAAGGDPAEFDPTIVANAPGVAASGVVDGFAVFEILADGTIDFVHVPALLAPEDGVAFSELNRPILVQGRLPNPHATDEVVESEVTEGLGHPVGSTLDLCLFDFSDLGALAGGDPTPAEQRGFVADHCVMRQMRVVGVARPDADEVVLHPTSEGQQFLIGPPAFAAAPPKPRTFSFVQVDLARGADPATFVNTVLDREPSDTETTVQSSSLRAVVVGRTVAPYVRALTFFCIAAAIAGIGVMGPPIARWAAVTAQERRVLAALGLLDRQVRLVGVVRSAALGVVAAAVAAAIAISSSSRFPIGVARSIEPQPGVRVDLDVLLLGAGILIALCVGFGSFAMSDESGQRRSSWLIEKLQSAGVSPARLLGIRGALRGPRSGALGVTIAIMAVASAITFQSGLGRMLDTPSRYGWTWDALVDSRDVAMAPQELEALRATPIAQSVSLGRRVSLITASSAIEAFNFTRLRGSVEPLITAGREPRGSAEIALGQQTMTRLHKRIGDELTLRGPNNARIAVTIVGRTLVPLINVSQDLSVGEGALIDRPLLDRVGGAHVALALVDLRPGSSIDDLRAALGQAGPRLAAGTVFGPTHTADLRGYDAVRGTPLLLAGVLALMGLGVLGYTIAAVTTRRRRELAVMRCLGSLRRDLRSSIRWNAIMIVISCLAVALPLGVALGRVLWQVFAQGLGVSDDAVTPLLALGAVVTATGLSAVLLAIVPGLRAGRMRPAEVLRGE